ncbi:MAG: DNA-directed RNA polymerase II core subunit [Pycnora praestabilis]|nr:MAG: DNA-directed RNA polymerase II core subunit [Pycnora praestabilis]
MQKSLLDSDADYSIDGVSVPRDDYRPNPYLPPFNPHQGFDSNDDNKRDHKKPVAADNVPGRFELFLLGEGEKKVVMTPDTRIPSSALFTFNKEDHTLGNLLRSRLLTSPHVTFAGYKVPHPLFSNFELRVQTDGEMTPKDALVQACRDIVQDLGALGREFTKEWELRKMVGEGAGNQ